MRLIICVLLLTLSSLATAQKNDGLTTAEVVEHLGANEAMVASVYRICITILFGWLTASHSVGHKKFARCIRLESLSKFLKLLNY